MSHAAAVAVGMASTRCPEAAAVVGQEAVIGMERGGSGSSRNGLSVAVGPAAWQIGYSRFTGHIQPSGNMFDTPILGHSVVPDVNIQHTLLQIQIRYFLSSYVLYCGICWICWFTFCCHLYCLQLSEIFSKWTGSCSCFRPQQLLHLTFL